ncbi:hypothetical protein [Priestia megaterium]|uniref:hypothetical protein n=1 Tax=Priestia megaterium TaxID=1404 RepID=UPI0030F487AA
MADSAKKAQLLRGLLAQTASNVQTDLAAALPVSMETQSPIVSTRDSFRQRLINAQESGQPIPDVTLNNGERFTNVVVTEVGSDSVVLTDPTSDLTAIVQIDSISNFGTLSPQ